MGEVDANWLYSSILQSSAAIVGIIGGFITSAVINLSVKRRAIEEEIEDHAVEAARLQALAAEARTGGERLRAWHLILDRSSRLAAFDGMPPDAEGGRRLMGAEEIEPTAFEAEWQPFAERWRAQRKQLLYHVMSHGWGDDYLFEEWAKVAQFDASHPDAWMAEEIWRFGWQANRPKPKSELEPPTLGAMGALGLKAPSSDLRSLYLPLPPHIVQMDREAKQRREDDRNEALAVFATEAKAYELSAAEATHRVETLRPRLREVDRRPDRLGFGYFALVVLTLGGIVAPLVFMPATVTEGYDTWHKWLAIGMFLVGLTLVLAYIAMLLFPWLTDRGHSPRLRPDGQRGAQPEHFAS